MVHIRDCCHSTTLQGQQNLLLFYKSWEELCVYEREIESEIEIEIDGER